MLIHVETAIFGTRLAVWSSTAVARATHTLGWSEVDRYRQLMLTAATQATVVALLTLAVLEIQAFISLRALVP